MRIPTITIEGQDGNPLVINQDEFDSNKHKIYGAGDIVAAVVPTLPLVQPAAPVAVDANGNPVNAGDGGQMVPPAQTSAPASQDGTQQPASPELMLVQKKGKKFLVVNLAGEEIERDGIVKGGYASEDEARQAINALTGPTA